jgi:hypothetical protein
MTRCASKHARFKHAPLPRPHCCPCSDLNFDTVVHSVTLEYNCLITDNLVESTRLAEAKAPAEAVPAFDPFGSVTSLGSSLGSKVTGAGSDVRTGCALLLSAGSALSSCASRTFFQAMGSVTSHIPDFSIGDKVRVLRRPRAPHSVTRSSVQWHVRR